VYDDQIAHHDLAREKHWVWLLKDVGRAGLEASSDEDQLDACLDRGFEIVEGIAFALNPDRWDDTAKPLAGWHHRRHLDLATKTFGEPCLPKLELEGLAGAYLQLSYRVDALDRLLVDLLMATEIFAFADEMKPLLKPSLPLPLKWLLSNATTLLVGLSIAALTLWLAPGSTAGHWVAGIVAVLTLGSVAWSLIVFPFVYPAARRQRQKFDGVIAGMRDAYAAMGGSPASVRHVRERVQHAIDAGVVWPAPLMALLDDIEGRRMTI
jgi:hypothetical protein